MSWCVACRWRQRIVRVGQSGLTLVELVFAIMLLAIAGVTLLGAYQVSHQLAEVAQQTRIAVNDLKTMMEHVKSTPFASLTTSFPNGVPNGPGGNAYSTLLGGYGMAGEQITVAYPNPAANPLEVIVTVSWTYRSRPYTRTLSTFRSS